MCVTLAPAVILAACTSFDEAPEVGAAGTAKDGGDGGGAVDAGDVVAAQDGSDWLGLDLVAHWALDEGSGTNIRDSQGENLGTFEGTVNWVPGHEGGSSLQFDGIDSDVYMSRALSLDVGQRMTFAAWLWSSAIPDIQYVYSHAYAFALRLNNRHPQILGDTEGVQASYPVLDDGWRHLAVSVDEGVVAFYLDGQPIPNVVDSGTVGLGKLESGGFLRIGASPERTFSFNGSIDDVWLWRRVLTPREIAMLAARK